MGIDWTVVITVVGSLIVALIAYIISPKLSYKREIKRIYEAPFHAGCATYYGEALEFYERYIKLNTEGKKDDGCDGKRDDELESVIKRFGLSNIQIIDDFRALHESQEEIHKWLGKIKKKNKDAAEGISKFADIVDRIWHEMESHFEVYIRKSLKTRDDALRIGGQGREDIARWLMKQLDGEATILKENFEKGEGYLKKQIP